MFLPDLGLFCVFLKHRRPRTRREVWDCWDLTRLAIIFHYVGQTYGWELQFVPEFVSDHFVLYWPVPSIGRRGIACYSARMSMDDLAKILETAWTHPPSKIPYAGDCRPNGATRETVPGAESELGTLLHYAMRISTN